MWLFFALAWLGNYVSTVFGKQFGITNKWWYAIVSILMAAMSSLFWSLMMKKQVDLSAITPLMSISLIISVVITGVLVYNEPLNFQKVAGVILGLVAIFLIIKS